MHVHVFWLYPIKCMCECLKIISICFLVNMLSLEKMDVPVLEIGCFGFCDFADKTG
jgi:hypothetical protein